MNFKIKTLTDETNSKWLNCTPEGSTRTLIGPCLPSLQIRILLEHPEIPTVNDVLIRPIEYKHGTNLSSLSILMPLVKWTSPSPPIKKWTLFPHRLPMTFFGQLDVVEVGVSYFWVLALWVLACFYSFSKHCHQHHKNKLRLACWRDPLEQNRSS